MTKCHSCDKSIPPNTEHYSLNLERIKQDDAGYITVLCSIEIKVWCHKCYAELQGLLKVNKAII